MKYSNTDRTWLSSRTKQISIVTIYVMFLHDGLRMTLEFMIAFAKIQVSTACSAAANTVWAKPTGFKMTAVFLTPLLKY